MDINAWIDIGQNSLLASWAMLREMALWLLLGLLLAGVLHVWVPVGWIQRHLSQDGWRGVLKASLFGMPLPLCSCGVLPVASHLRKSGASRGATTAFLVSTPVTGIDSILVTHAMMGPVIAVIRPLASVLAGVLAGLWAGKDAPSQELPAAPVPSQLRERRYASTAERVRKVFAYAFGDLLPDVAKWLAIGIVAAGVITAAIPDSFFTAFAASGPWTYVVLLLVGLPLYVCATGSLPIAAALVLKGVSPGAVLVFLIAGPAANSATISFVGGLLGRRTLVVYLAAIFVVALGSGVLLDLFFPNLVIMTPAAHHSHEEQGGIFSTAGAAVLAVLLAWHLRPSFMRPRKRVLMSLPQSLYQIPDISCQKCKQHVEAAVADLPGVQSASVDVERKELRVQGTYDDQALRARLESKGYPAR